MQEQEKSAINFVGIYLIFMFIFWYLIGPLILKMINQDDPLSAWVIYTLLYGFMNPSYDGIAIIAQNFFIGFGAFYISKMKNSQSNLPNKTKLFLFIGVVFPLILMGLTIFFYYLIDSNSIFLTIFILEKLFLAMISALAAGCAWVIPINSKGKVGAFMILFIFISISLIYSNIIITLLYTIICLAISPIISKICQYIIDLY